MLVLTFFQDFGIKYLRLIRLFEIEDLSSSLPNGKWKEWYQ
jgi:hypothetical protein